MRPWITRIAHPLRRVASEVLSSAQEFLALPRIHAPCCLLLDVDLPGLSGLDLQQRVSDRTDMPIIFIADRSDVSTTVKAMKAGAVEFLMKPFRNDVIRNAMRDALERSRVALRHEAEMSVLQEHHAALTRREREVMELVLSGLLNKQIAAKLGITEITVKVHRGSMMRKMGADSLLDLVKIATRLRLTPVTQEESRPQRKLALSSRNRSRGVSFEVLPYSYTTE